MVTKLWSRNQLGKVGVEARIKIDLREMGSKVYTAFTLSRIQPLTMLHFLNISFSFSDYIFVSTSFHLHHSISLVCKHVPFFFHIFLFHDPVISFFSPCFYLPLCLFLPEVNLA
jgi:hypothetical protein